MVFFFFGTNNSTDYYSISRMPNLLDEMLAEIEGSLTTPDRRELCLEGQLQSPEIGQGESPLAAPPRPIRLSSCTKDSPHAEQTLLMHVHARTDSPLPPPPSHCADCTAAIQMPGSCKTDIETGPDNDEPAGWKSTEKWIQAKLGGCKERRRERNDVSRANVANDSDGLHDDIAAKTAVRAAARNSFPLAHTDGCGLTEWSVYVPPGEALQVKCIAQGNSRMDGTVSNSLSSCAYVEATEHNSVSSSAHVEATEHCSPQLSAEEFKKKVDCKIMHFETLALESRLKAQEQAAVEQVLQEARSRIEASNQKRRKSMSAAAPTMEDMEPARKVLGFEPDALSLSDLAGAPVDPVCCRTSWADPPDASAGSDEQPAQQFLSSEGAFNSTSVKPPGTSNENVCPSEETVDISAGGRKSSIGNWAAPVIPKSLKKVFGISPVLEANTPDMSNGDISPMVHDESLVLHEHKQQHLFSHAQTQIIEGKSPVVSHVDVPVDVAEAEGKEITKEVELGANIYNIDTQTLAAEGQCTTVSTEGGHAILAEMGMKTKTWAGALACATPTRPSLQNFASRHDTHVDTRSDEQSSARDKHEAGVVLAKLEDFWCSLSLPEGANDELYRNNSSSEFSDRNLGRQFEGEPVGDHSIGKSDTQQKECGRLSQEDKTSRASARRAVFLASMNQFVQDASTCEGASGIVVAPSIDEPRIMQSVGTRAQRLSDIASSCDFSSANLSSNKITSGSSPHFYVVRSDSNSSLNKASPVLPNFCEGTAAMHIIDAVNLASNATNAGSSQECSIFSVLNNTCNSSGSKPTAPAQSSMVSSGSPKRGEHLLSANSSDCPEANAHNSSPSTGATSAGGETENEKRESAGIGVQVKRVRGHITVVDLLPDGPAAFMLKKGQIILQIDGTGLATLSFKSVLSKFRGPPGSIVLLTVVDSASALNRGQVPQTVAVRRFRAPASARRLSLLSQAPAPLNEKTGKSAAPNPMSIQLPSGEATSFGSLPRAELSHESGLCSPYSDPGDSIRKKEQRRCRHAVAKADSSPGVPMAGAVSIDILQNRLLNWLSGGNVASSTERRLSDDVSIVSFNSPLDMLTPSHDSLRGDVLLQASNERAQPHFGTATKVDEKFRCLVANTAHWPKGAHALPLCITGSSTDIKQDSNQNKESASRSKDFGKRVLSPNSSSTQAQFNRAEKRVRHNQEMSGPSIFSSLPTHKTARSSVPRKPALPSFSSTTTRSSSAPKTIPVVQEQSTKKTKDRVASSMDLPGAHRSLAKNTFSSSSTSSRNPVRAFASSDSTKKPKTSSPSQSRSRTIEKRKMLSPITSNGPTTRGGNTRESKHSAAKNNSPHQNLLVYADVGRAVTSLMQKFTQTPDSNRSMVPNKDEIIEVLGKLFPVSSVSDLPSAAINQAHPQTDEHTKKSCPSTVSTCAPAAHHASPITLGAQSVEFSSAQPSEHYKTIKSPAECKVHANSKASGDSSGGGAEGDKENVGNRDSSKRIALTSSSKTRTGTSEKNLTFDAVLKTRFRVHYEC